MSMKELELLWSTMQAPKAMETSMSLACVYHRHGTFCQAEGRDFHAHMYVRMYTYVCMYVRVYVVCIKGGSGGGQGVWPPLLCHDVGFLTLGPKLDPRLAPPFLLVDLT